MSVYKKNELTTSFLIKLNCRNTSIRYTVIRILSTEFEFFFTEGKFQDEKIVGGSPAIPGYRYSRDYYVKFRQKFNLHYRNKVHV